MTSQETITMPAETQPERYRPVDEILNEVQSAVPELLNTLKPSDAAEQRRAFLADEIDEPQPSYDKLMSIDFETVDEQLKNLGQELQDHPDVDEKYKPQYAEFITYRRKLNQFLGVRKILETKVDETNPKVAWAASVAKSIALRTYEQLNKELFGEVDKATTYALLSNELANLKVDKDDADGNRILAELRALVAQEALKKLPLPYEKDEATFEAVKKVVTALYGDMLDRDIPKGEEHKDKIYTPEEVHAVLRNIVREFGVLKENVDIYREEGVKQTFLVNPDGWEVRVVDQKGLSVDAKHKLIKVSPTIELDPVKFRGLVVHELGVHMMRAILGGQTNFLPLEIGMAGHMPTEEGTASVLQQAEVGVFEIAGAGHAITDGLLAIHKSTRKTFEIKWLLEALKKLKAGEQITSAGIKKARDVAYTATYRLAKGNGKYHVSKDLAYYNGSKIMWEYFRGFGGDEFTTYLALMGKLNPTDKDQVITATETKAA